MPEAPAARARGTTETQAPDARGRIAAVHALLVRTRFYPAAACSLFGGALLLARWSWTGKPAFLFFVWNLFLAWLPWLFALPLEVMSAERGRGWRAVIPFAAWLVFLPNAPYIVTDLLHLVPRPPIPYWYDSALFFVFAWTGCVLGFASLSIVHARVERWLGRLAGWAFVGLAALLTGFGIYLGRFLRWNSWEVLTRPRGLFEDFVDRIALNGDHPRLFAFTLLFAGFFVAAYGSVRTLNGAR